MVRPFGSLKASTNGRGLRARDGLLRQDVEIELVVEVARVADDRAVLHDLEVLVADDVIVAGHRDEDVADLGGLGHRHHHEAVHRRFERLTRIDLGDYDVRAEALGARRDATSAPAVADDHDGVARQQNVGGANDPVDGRCPVP